MFTSLIIWFKALVNCPKCSNPASIYLFKTNNRKTKKRCEICSNLTIKIPWRRRHQFLLLTLNTNHTFFYFFYCWLWLSQCQLGNDSVNDFLLVSIANFKHILHIILGFSLLTLKKQMLRPLFHVNFKKMQILPVSQNINIQVSGRVFQILLRCRWGGGGYWVE